jgi:hypothetical protein
MIDVSVAQSVRIVPEEARFYRPQPLDEYKKSFLLTRPKVSGVPEAIARKIEEGISYEKVTKLDLKEELESSWLTDGSFEVGFNERGILSISLLVCGSGAYPDCSANFVVVDIPTGDVITPEVGFDNLRALSASLRKSIIREIKKYIPTKTENKNEDSDWSWAIERLSANLERLNQQGSEDRYSNLNEDDILSGFSVAKEGVTFRYDYGFARAIRTLQPPGEFLYKWNELRPFIKKGGPFSRFLK